MPDQRPRAAARPHAKYDRLIERARKHPAMATAVAHPCDAVSLESAVEAARLGLLKPILVGPSARLRDVAARAGLDIGAFEIVDSTAQPRIRPPRRSSSSRRAAPKP